MCSLNFEIQNTLFLECSIVVLRRGPWQFSFETVVSYVEKLLPGFHLRLMTTRIFFKFFLRDRNSQHFNEDLIAVNASAFSFVLFFKAIDYTGASRYVISAKWTTLENF